MQTVGDYLKHEREARKISLSEVSQLTKVSRHYLECLEKNEYEKIPRGPYLKGYIMSYAASIGINRKEALERYYSSQQDVARATENTCEKPRSDSKKPLKGNVANRRSWFLSGFTICFVKFKNAIKV